MVLVLPASLNDDAGAENQRHQEDSVPQLLQVLLQHTRSEARRGGVFSKTHTNSDFKIKDSVLGEWTAMQLNS